MRLEKHEGSPSAGGGLMFRHEPVKSTWLSFLILPALVFTACIPTVGNTGGQAAPGASGANNCSPLPLDRKAFPDTPKVDNKYLPFIPGMQFFLDGFVAADDGTRHPHRIDTTVTQLTKVIDGVNTIVIFDRDIQDGQLAESELFFVAQDNQGKVWTFGEYPEEYDNGRLVGAPSAWLAGVAGGRAGIAMVDKPRVGSPTYLQGLAPEVGFKDCATVFETGRRVCVPVKCYDNVVVTDEFAPLKPRDGHQRKYYAPGAGNVKVAAAGGVDPETLELSKAARLCPSEFANVQGQALSQDSRGYQVAKDLYGDTPPAKQTLPLQNCDG
jgi:hypothetical protein